MLVAIDTNDKMRSEGAGLLAEVGVSIVPQITYHVDVHALGKLLSADAADEAVRRGRTTCFFGSAMTRRTSEAQRSSAVSGQRLVKQ